MSFTPQVRPFAWSPMTESTPSAPPGEFNCSTAESWKSQARGTMPSWMSTSVRRLLQAPAFLFGVVLTLSLGLGASPAMFGFISAVFIKPLPFRDADTLVELSYSTVDGQKSIFTQDEYRRLDQVAPGLNLESLTFAPGSGSNTHGQRTTPCRRGRVAMSDSKGKTPMLGLLVDPPNIRDASPRHRATPNGRPPSPRFP